jgi:hypothetical protein
MIYYINMMRAMISESNLYQVFLVSTLICYDQPNQKPFLDQCKLSQNGHLI